MGTKGDKMIHSNQNNAYHPTVRFWQIVHGWLDIKGNEHVETVQLRVNREKAERVYNRLPVENYRAYNCDYRFVRIFEVNARASRKDDWNRTRVPSLRSRFLKQRIY